MAIDPNARSESVRQGHTPGPWEASAPGDYADFDGDSRVILGDDRRIAVVHWSYETHGGDTECDANARLIAAAPSILAALEEARAALHQHYVDWDGEPEDAIPLLLARDKCDDAIALAEPPALKSDELPNPDAGEV